MSERGLQLGEDDIVVVYCHLEEELQSELQGRLSLERGTAVFLQTEAGLLLVHRSFHYWLQLY